MTVRTFLLWTKFKDWLSRLLCDLNRRIEDKPGGRVMFLTEGIVEACVAKLMEEERMPIEAFTDERTVFCLEAEYNPATGKNDFKFRVDVA